MGFTKYKVLFLTRIFSTRCVCKSGLNPPNSEWVFKFNGDISSDL